jgi:hypothetical protein
MNSNIATYFDEIFYKVRIMVLNKNIVSWRNEFEIQLNLIKNLETQ